MYTINYNSFRSVNSFNQRVRFLVLHYTAENFQDSVNSLTQEVSSHYLVPDPDDPTYLAKFKELLIFNMVDEDKRAWHAGGSTWSKRANINDTSIGIEIVNLASESEGHFNFPPYNPQQFEAVRQLCYNIIQRYPDISPTNVVAHSDIAVGRKSDPGPAFHWEDLYKSGIGAWYDDALKEKYTAQFTTQGIPDQKSIIKKLQTYGYSVDGAETAQKYQQLIRAFQLHFRQKEYSGTMDVETAAIIYALVEKYFKKSIADANIA